MPGIQIDYNWNLEYESKKTGKQVENKRETVDILIEFYEKVRLDEDYKNELIDNGILTDKGLSKAKIKELLDMKDITFKKSMNKPLMLQYIKDKNIDIESNNRYIKLNYNIS